MFEFEYEVNDNDYLDFNKYHIYNSDSSKKQILYARFGYPILYMFIAVVFAMNSKYPAISFIVFSVLSVCWIIFFKRINNRYLQKHIVRLKKNGKLPYHKNAFIKFDNDDIFEKTESSETRIQYSAIERIAHDHNAIYLYYSAIQAFIMPLRIFKNDNEKDAFVDFIKTKAVNCKEVTP